jgi:uncharacterized integral membrane protein (TIGR00697 family)
MQNRKENSEFVFLLLAAIFISSLIIGNIIGTSKFVTIFSLSGNLNFIPNLLKNSAGNYVMAVPVGILAYPITFIATDLICEFYGKDRAAKLVLVGFFMNIFMVLLLSVGYFLPDASGVSGNETLFFNLYNFMVTNVIASMLAYLIAQNIDVKLFHFFKKLTKGKHLWLRNNGSTMCSQMIDSISILSILYFSGSLGENINSLTALMILILNSYVFKFFFAVLDTPVIYFFHYIFKNKFSLKN